VEFLRYGIGHPDVEIRVDRDRHDIVLFETMIQRRLALRVAGRRGAIARVQLTALETPGVRKHQQNRQ